MSERRAPVQGDSWRPPRIPCVPRRPAGTISWEEHLEIYERYAARYGRDQSAERLAQRGGFGYGEATELLGRQPATWRPRERV